MRREFKCVFVGWDRAYDICEHVCTSIREAAFRPEVVVGVSRGGLFLARIICDFFRLKDLLCLKIEHWGVTATITGEAEMKYGLDDRAKQVLRGKRVIVADDITDTGESLRIAAEYVRSTGVEDVRTAAMHHKSVSSFVPDFYGERIDEWVWVIYPWSFYEDISHLITNLLVSGLDVEEIKESLQRVYDLHMSSDDMHKIIENMVFHGEIEQINGKVVLKKKRNDG
ncbi:phosphoribosyltransferase [Methanosarcinales archaeon]|nr:MAG: phosphoribosyltransferase [Methanosarcinales archaeon]